MTSADFSADDIPEDGIYRLGTVGVDSGQLLVTDPCYIGEGFAADPDDLRFDVPGEYSYSGCCSTTISNNIGGNLGKETGVVFSSGFGDGSYPVYAHIVEGRVIGVVIDMGMNYFGDEAEERDAHPRLLHRN
jgi:hypothetical protein